MEENPASNPYAPPAAEILATDSQAGEGPLKDPRLRGWFAGGSIALNCLICLVLVLRPPGWGDDDVLTGIVSASSILAIITYLVWLHRCAGNALVLGREGGSASPRWAVGSYFVPLANWVVPCQIMMEIARKTFRYRPAQGMKGLILVWWLSHLTRSVIDRWTGETTVALVWLAATFIAGGTICYLIARISQAQADFRWSDAPESARPSMVPLGPRMLPQARSMGIPPRRELPPRRGPSFPPMKPPMRPPPTPKAGEPENW
jgi:hypothetical protein